MKINIIGNTNNRGFLLAKSLRKKGIDARLFIIKPFHIQYLPESVDPVLANGYPDWIQVIKAKHFCKNIPFLMHPFFEIKLLKELSNCDIIHAFEWGSAYAQFCKRPFLFHATGGDINMIARKRFTFNYEKIGVFVRKVIKLRRNGIRDSWHEIWGGPYLWLGYLMRRALKNCAFVLTGGTDVLINQSVNNFGVNDKAFYLQGLIDSSKFKVRKTGELYKNSFVVFSSARHVWNNEYSKLGEEDLVKYVDVKGNDRPIKAFARLAQTCSDVKMVLIETGRNVPESKKLIKELGIERNVIWMEHQERNRLIDLYNRADVAFDQFWLATLGFSGIEVLFCGTPLVTYLADGGRLYQDVVGSKPPVLNCRTEDEIYEALLWCYNNRKEAKELGLKGREWVMKHNDADTCAVNYVELYKQVISQRQGSCLKMNDRLFCNNKLTTKEYTN